jgi:hypothetical protein
MKDLHYAGTNLWVGGRRLYFYDGNAKLLKVTTFANPLGVAGYPQCSRDECLSLIRSSFDAEKIVEVQG